MQYSRYRLVFPEEDRLPGLSLGLVLAWRQISMHNHAAYMQLPLLLLLLLPCTMCVPAYLPGLCMFAQVKHARYGLLAPLPGDLSPARCESAAILSDMRAQKGACEAMVFVEHAPHRALEIFLQLLCGTSSRELS